MKILVASILKPVSDSRMYEKIAISLSRLPNVEIHVAGFEGELCPPSNIHIHPLFNFKRLSWGRFRAPWKFYKLLLKVKPEYIIVTTHELLIVTIIYKILFGSRIIYDVQENYFRNIAFSDTFPPLIRHLLAGWVRLKEVASRPFIFRYFLAEKNYEKEFSFSKEKSIILENKTRKSLVLPRLPHTGHRRIRLLYSGTISENYGVFEAVNLAMRLHKLAPETELVIIGYSSKYQTLNKLKESIQPYPFIRLKGGDRLVPHHEILQEIAASDFGLVSYQYNKSTKNCIPTKLYEYLAFRLPVIVQNNPLWTGLVNRYQAGIVTDFSNPDLAGILSSIREKRFYEGLPPEGIYWEDEEKKLFEALNI